jgi:hypothetical protein
MGFGFLLEPVESTLNSGRRKEFPSGRHEKQTAQYEDNSRDKAQRDRVAEQETCQQRSERERQRYKRVCT